MNILKIVLWSMAIVGLLPIVLFSLLHFTICLSMFADSKRQHAQDGEVSDGEVLITSSSYWVSFPSFMAHEPISISRGLWPSLCILIGAALIVGGMAALHWGPLSVPK